MYIELAFGITVGIIVLGTGIYLVLGLLHVIQPIPFDLWASISMGIIALTLLIALLTSKRSKTENCHE